MGKTFRSYADSRRIQFLKTIISALFIFASAPGFSQLKEPDVPDVPDIDITEQQVEKIRAQVTIYGSSVIKVELQAGSGLTINGADGKIYPLDVIGKITVRKWVMKREGSNLIFYPEEYEVLLKNQTKITVNGNIAFLNRMKASVDKKQKILYTFYYDYYKKGRWVNSGTVGLNQPSETPAKGTAYIIELN